MGRLGLPELLIILVVVLIIFGAGKLPEIGGAMGKAIRQFKKEKDGANEQAQPKKKAAKKVTEAKEAK